MQVIRHSSGAKEGATNTGIPAPQGSGKILASSGTVTRRSASLKCPRFCKCSCHRLRISRTPPWLRVMCGVACLRYNNLPGYGCDSPACRSKSATSIAMQYYPPQWLAARGLLASLTWNTLTGTGASLWIRVPRILHMPFLRLALESDDVEGNLSILGVLPTDVDEVGGSPLAVGLKFPDGRFTLLM